MKKILLSLFILSSLTLYSSEANMNVNANVLDTLTIRIDQDVEFGNIAKGSSNNTAIGKFSIKGENGETVNVKFEGLENNEIQLVHISGKTMTARFEGIQSNQMNLQNSSFNQFEELRFVLDVPEDIAKGTYESEFKIKVKYN